MGNVSPILGDMTLTEFILGRQDRHDVYIQLNEDEQINMYCIIQMVGRESHRYPLRIYRMTITGIWDRANSDTLEPHCRFTEYFTGAYRKVALFDTKKHAEAARKLLMPHRHDACGLPLLDNEWEKVVEQLKIAEMPGYISAADVNA